MTYGCSNVKKGDWIVIGGSYSGQAYMNMKPTNLINVKIIFYADSGGNWTSYMCILEVLGVPISFTRNSGETKGTISSLIV